MPNQSTVVYFVHGSCDSVSFRIPAKPLIERHNSVGLQAVGFGDVPHDDGSEAKLEGLPHPGDHKNHPADHYPLVI